MTSGRNWKKLVKTVNKIDASLRKMEWFFLRFLEIQKDDDSIRRV